MFSGISRIAVFAVLYRLVKPRLIGLSASIGFILLTGIIHGEYLSYVSKTSSNEYILMSFLIKWSAFILTVLVYLITVELPIRRRKKRIHNLNSRNISDKKDDDGFDTIRKKDKLLTTAEKLLKKD